MKEIRKNEIVLTRSTWGDKLFQKVGEVLEILLKEQQICTVRDDDTGIIIIRHEHDENHDAWGCDNPYWITDEEYEIIEWERWHNNNHSDEECEDACHDKCEDDPTCDDKYEFAEYETKIEQK